MTNHKAGFIEMYFIAEKRAVPQANGNLTFTAADRLAICQRIKWLEGVPGMDTVHRLSVILAANCPKGSKFDRHKWRLNKWMTDFKAGTIEKELNSGPVVSVPVAVAPKPVTKSVKPPVTKAVKPVEVNPNADYLMFKQNILGSIKSVVRSAIKHNLSQTEIMSLLTGGLKEATEEYQVEQNQLKFSAFLRQNNIDKNTALDILQRL